MINFNLHPSCRAQIVLIIYWTPIFNLFNELQEKLNIETFAIKNKLKCIWNVWKQN